MCTFVGGDHISVPAYSVHVSAYADNTHIHARVQHTSCIVAVSMYGVLMADVRVHVVQRALSPNIKYASCNVGVTRQSTRAPASAKDVGGHACSGGLPVRWAPVG